MNRISCATPAAGCPDPARATHSYTAWPSPVIGRSDERKTAEVIEIINMSQPFKKPAAGPHAAAWDAEFSPLHLSFHHDDPARGERLLIVDGDGRRIVSETPETFAQYMAFMYDADCDHALLGQNGVGPAVKIRLRWADALAFLRRCDWKTIPVEKRVHIGFHGALPPKWAVAGWNALDAGLIRPDDLSWEAPTEAELADSR